MVYFTPGPVPIHPDTANAMHSLPYHKADIYHEVLQSLDIQLRKLFDSGTTIIPFGGSGTTAAEIAMRTLCMPRSKVLVLVNGRFSARWAMLASIFSCEVHTLSAQWGSIVTLDELEQYLQGNTPDSIWLTQTETSTGITTPIELYSRTIKHYAPNAFICVDAVSSIICEDFSMKNFAIDCVVSASQKGLAAPPGLGLLGMSNRAKDFAIEQKLLGNAYPSMVFDIDQLYTRFAEHIPLYTPPLPIISALHASTSRIVDSLDAYRERLHHQRHSIREGLLPLSDMCTILHENAANGLTTVQHPKAKQILHELQNNGYYIAGGQESWADSTLRIGHMVPYSDEEINGLIATLTTIISRIS